MKIGRRKDSLPFPQNPSDAPEERRGAESDSVFRPFEEQERGGAVVCWLEKASVLMQRLS